MFETYRLNIGREKDPLKNYTFRGSPCIINLAYFRKCQYYCEQIMRISRDGTAMCHIFQSIYCNSHYSHEIAEKNCVKKSQLLMQQACNFVFSEIFAKKKYLGATPFSPSTWELKTFEQKY